MEVVLSPPVLSFAHNGGQVKVACVGVGQWKFKLKV